MWHVLWFIWVKIIKDIVNTIYSGKEQTQILGRISNPVMLLITVYVDRLLYVLAPFSLLYEYLLI